MSTQAEIDAGYEDMVIAIRGESTDPADNYAVKALPELPDAGAVLAATQVQAFLALRNLYREAYPETRAESRGGLG